MSASPVLGLAQHGASVPLAPQGRLTLTSGTAITTNDVAGAISILWTATPNGNSASIWDGARWIVRTLHETALVLDGNAAHAGFHQGGKNFDLFLFFDASAGVVRLASGPAWISDTARGTGAGTTELDLTTLFPTNKNAITLRFDASAATAAIAANQATYVGTFRAVANGQTSDSVAQRFLWNLFNQAARPLKRTEPTGTWTYSAAAWRQANGNVNNRVEVVIGLVGMPVELFAMGFTATGAGTGTSFVGIGVDSTTVNAADVTGIATSFSTGLAAFGESIYRGSPGLGYHALNWLEYAVGGGAQTWFGDSGTGIYKPGLNGEVWA